jgi:hypothetical protein
MTNNVEEEFNSNDEFEYSKCKYKINILYNRIEYFINIT